MKAFYEIPELEIVAFEVEDIITTSGDLNDIFQGSNTEEGWSDFV